MMVMMMTIPRVTAVSGACALLGVFTPQYPGREDNPYAWGAQIKKHMAPEVSASL